VLATWRVILFISTAVITVTQAGSPAMDPADQQLTSPNGDPGKYLAVSDEDP